MQPRVGIAGAGAVLLTLCAALLTVARAADRVSVAAAANFVYALEALVAEHKRAAPATVVTSTTGASGSLFAQIKNGAPFDLFLSADTDYPRQLVAAGLADSSTFRVFATGRLVVWTLRNDVDLDDLAAVVRSPLVRRIALAQPATAPYGRAAREVLAKKGLWTETQPKLVFGESISQTAQFVQTRNADIGFVALSLVRSAKLADQGRWKEIEPGGYATVSLDHAAVLTIRGAQNAAARQFLAFLATEPAQKILHQFGYGVLPARERAGNAP